jgi:murein DD-endopeptidase MepM/ murein hydrolase activator NlpD
MSMVIAILFVLLAAAGCGWVEWPPSEAPSEPAASGPAPNPVAGSFPNPIPKPVARPPVRAVRKEPRPVVAPPRTVTGRGSPASATTATTAPIATTTPPAATIQVARGDTIYAISRRHQVSVRSIIEANSLTPPYQLNAGERIILPRDRQHVVGPGETVYGISRAYGVDAYELATANGLVAPFALHVGQTLRVPASGSELARLRPTTTAPAISARRPSSPVTVPPPPPASGGFVWPVRGRVVSSFGAKSKGLHNDGINIAAQRGTPVRAAENGVVAYAGNELRGFGNMLLIKHAGGWITAYAHNEKLLVSRGDKVRKGQIVARVGSSGSVSRPQLHFELRKGKQAVNPRKYLRKSST